MALLRDPNPTSTAVLPRREALPSVSRTRESASVLVLSCNHGGGHRSAAHALREWWARHRPGWNVTISDYLAQFVHPIYARISELSYVQSVRLVPSVYGFFYELTANLANDSRLQVLINQLGKIPLYRYLQRHPVDLIVCVHHTPAGALSELKGDRRVTCPVATVVTDLVVHSQWIHPHIDLYLVGSETVRDGLVERGIPPERIRITGIPIAERYATGVDVEAARRALRLRPDLPGVLVMVGAAGMVRKAIEVYYAMRDLPVEIYFVCGHDRRLRRRLEALTADIPQFHILGYVDNVPELMAACDLTVTKAGGLTISEALAMELPMLIYRPIPGQEYANRDYLLQAGAAVYARTRRELREQLIELIRSPARLEAMRAAARAIRRPHAAAAAAAAMSALVEGGEQ